MKGFIGNYLLLSSVFVANYIFRSCLSLFFQRATKVV
jgi:hypothetical protein